METPRRFGDYALLKSLAADDLGETYRAGRLAGATLEQIVLLRLFNGEAIDRPRLWRAVADRAPLQKLHAKARLAEGVDLGIVAGTPFAAYAYESGRDLLELFRQARESSLPIPAEHGLFVAERMAQRLNAAWETRFHGERLFHGFLAPGLVRLSVEGEVRLLGGELAPGLTEQAELFESAQITPYLAPEIREGEPAVPADDIYSLAAILFELLTGKPPPADPGELAEALPGAKLAGDEAPIPKPIRELLAESVGRRASRVKSVDRWHRLLARIIHESDESPTTFNLAFFMHTLFRDEIDREREELEVERRQEVPPIEEEEAPEVPVAEPEPPAIAAAEAEALESELAETAAPMAAAESAVPAASTEPPEPDETATATEEAEPDEPSERPAAAVEQAPEPAPTSEAAPRPATAVGVGRSAAAPDEAGPRWLLPALTGAILLTAALLAGYYLLDWRSWVGDDSAPAPAEAPETSIEDEAAAAPAVEVVEEEPAGPSVEEVEAQVRELLTQRTGEMETEVRAEFEARLAGLRRQLAEAREAARRREEERARAAEEAASAVPEDEATTAAPQSEVATAAPESEAATAAPESEAAPAPAATAPAEIPRAAPAEPTTEVPRAAQRDATPEAAARPEAPAGRPAPSTPAASTGGAETVEAPPAEIVPPRLLSRPQPQYPPAARKFGKQATVKLRLLIDVDGRVADAERIGPKAGYGFDEAALRAARKTAWSPATRDGQPVEQWVELAVEFRP